MKAAVTDESSASGTGLRSRWFTVAPLLLAALFFIVLMGTRSIFFGDTTVYVEDVAFVLGGQRPFSSLLDFGHLIWRPIGLLLTHPSPGDGIESISRQIALSLIRVNFVASAICTIALWKLLRMVKGIGIGPAIFCSAAFLATNGFILLSHAGTAWIPGLACLLSACCCSLQASRRNSALLTVCAAALTAGSIVFWVPYLLGSLFVAGAPLLDWDESDSGKKALRSASRILPLAGLITVAAFGAAVLARHIATSTDFWTWVRSAAHGEDRNRQWLRMMFGFPRSFLVMGDDGVLWKQFLFHDPFAGVGLMDVLRASAWKVGFFYLVLAGATLELARKGRWLLLWALIGVVPTLVLAVAFEAGSVERYLALYPAIFVAFAWLLSQRTALAGVRVLVVLFCGVLIAGNLWVSSRPVIGRHRSDTLARVDTVRGGQQAEAVLTIFALNSRDELLSLYDPNDRTLDSVPKLKSLIPDLAPEIRGWRARFARTTLDTWQKGGQVWVSKRAWAERPRREWCWVENDNQFVKWNDIGAVLALLKVDAEAGGADGFNRLSATPENSEAVTSLKTAATR